METKKYKQINAWESTHAMLVNRLKHINENRKAGVKVLSIAAYIDLLVKKD